MVKGLAFASALSLGLCAAAPQPAPSLYPQNFAGDQVVIKNIPVKAVLRVSERLDMKKGYTVGMYFKGVLDANGDQIRLRITGCYNADGSTISVGDAGPTFVFSWRPFIKAYGARLPMQDDGLLASFTLFTFGADNLGPVAIWREGVFKFTCDGGAVWEVSSDHPYIEFELRPLGIPPDHDNKNGSLRES